MEEDSLPHPSSSSFCVVAVAYIGKRKKNRLEGCVQKIVSPLVVVVDDSTTNRLTVSACFLFSSSVKVVSRSTTSGGERRNEEFFMTNL